MNNKTIIKKGEEMIDQLHKILNEYDANKIDAMLNIDGIDWISKFDNEMVKNGYAVAFRRYSKDYVEVENYAKRNKLGLWSGSFTYPEKWRKLN